MLDGDPFALSGGRPPHVMPRGTPLTPEDLMARWGRPASGLKDRLEKPIL